MMDVISRPPHRLARLPFYFGWVNVMVAALAMVGTLPGRTQGLGLITEPLLKDLRLSDIEWANINLWASLIGALFCIGFGRLMDRFGSRGVLTVLAVALGLVVLQMSRTFDNMGLFVCLTLTRGLGQSALSVVSISIVGKWFVRGLSRAMAVYSIALSIGFMIAFPVVGAIVQKSGWRMAWGSIGWALLLGLAPLAWLLVRRSPEAVGLAVDGDRPDVKPDVPEASPPSAEAGPNAPEMDHLSGVTLIRAMGTPAFWVFALSSSLYGLIASGIGLFNERILAERGFGPGTFYTTLVVVAMTSLVGNFLGGWLATRWTMGRLMGLAMFILMASLLALPQVKTMPHVIAYAVAMGLAGGFVIVIFFSFWSRAYGRAYLGQIQGAAQMLTVLASAIGPLLLARYAEMMGSYAGIFYLLAVAVGVLGVAAWFIPVPEHREDTPAQL